MLDSGTTFTYLRSDAFNNIRKNFNNFCKLKSSNGFKLCGGQKVYRDASSPYCANYQQSVYKNLNNFFNSYPRLYLNIGNGVKIVWFPKDYLLYHKTVSPGVETFCTSIRKSAPGRPNSTLGNSFFRHYDIFFNRDHKQISFVRSECDDKALRAYPVHGIKTLVRRIQVLAGSMVGDSAWLVWFGLGLLVIIGNLVWWIRNKRQNEKKLEHTNEALVKEGERQDNGKTSAGAVKLEGN